MLWDLWLNDTRLGFLVAWSCGALLKSARLYQFTSAENPAHCIREECYTFPLLNCICRLSAHLHSFSTSLGISLPFQYRTFLPHLLPFCKISSFISFCTVPFSDHGYRSGTKFLFNGPFSVGFFPPPTPTIICLRLNSSVSLWHPNLFSVL